MLQNLGKEVGMIMLHNMYVPQECRITLLLSFNSIS